MEPPAVLTLGNVDLAVFARLPFALDIDVHLGAASRFSVAAGNVSVEKPIRVAVSTSQERQALLACIRRAQRHKTLDLPIPRKFDLWEAVTFVAVTFFVDSNVFSAARTVFLVDVCLEGRVAIFPSDALCVYLCFYLCDGGLLSDVAIAI